ncbi:MAG: glycosyltransferase family 2 protein [Candidatus Thermoplasmatota archaeon]|nr:glycosyltransferase family 2 protein [Candidatus Thermoplasmatota archaeon]
MKELSVEIPTYNEAENLPLIVEKLEELPVDMEIIVIDDNSPDGTASIAEELALKYKNIKVLKRPGKMGLASAIYDGMVISDGNYIAVMDADLQHPPQTLPLLLQRAKEGNDIVIASRYIENGGVEKFSFYRRIVSKSATFIAHLMLRETRSVSDPLSGFFIFRKDIVKRKIENYTGYKILLEILATSSGHKIAEVPYVFRPRLKGKSKLTMKENLDYMKLVFSLSRGRISRYIAVGLSGIILNEALLFMFRTFIFSNSYLGYLAFSSILAIEITTAANFLRNIHWQDSNVFGAVRPAKFLKYNGAMAPSILLNVLVLVALSPFITYLLANLVGIIIAIGFNYAIGGKLIVSPNATRI